MGVDSIGVFCTVTSSLEARLVPRAFSNAASSKAFNNLRMRLPRLIRPLVHHNIFMKGGMISLTAAASSSIASLTVVEKNCSLLKCRINWYPQHVQDVRATPSVLQVHLPPPYLHYSVRWIRCAATSPGSADCNSVTGEQARDGSENVALPAAGTPSESTSAHESGSEPAPPNHDIRGPFMVANLYHFTDIGDPLGEVDKHLAFLEGRDVMGRIYINHQGINAQWSGPEEDALAYGEWIKSSPKFAKGVLQISPSNGGHAFPRLRLRYKPSLVQVEGGTAHLPLTDPAARAVPLTPKQWKQKLREAAEYPAAEQQDHSGHVSPSCDESVGDAALQSVDVGGSRSEGGQDHDREHAEQKQPGLRGGAELAPGPSSGRDPSRKVLLLDVRNGYEWDVGHFKGAARPPVDNFRSTDFGLASAGQDRPEDPLADVDKDKTDIMMYCTGGIRCDVYSTLLRKRGFNRLYTLEGGVARYLKEEGDELWNGNLFVFDARLAVPPVQYQPGAGSASMAEAQVDLPLVEEASTPDQRVFASCTICQGHLEHVKHRNCANLDCNKLFLVCPACIASLSGACCTSCQSAPRLRPLLEGPYNRWHNYRPVTPGRPPGALSRRAVQRRRRKERRRLIEAGIGIIDYGGDDMNCREGDDDRNGDARPVIGNTDVIC